MVKFKDLVDEAVNSGITPIYLSYEPIHFFEGNKRVMRTFLVVESLDVGHLTYREYRFVARRTKLGDQMVQRHIEKLFRQYPQWGNEPDLDCVTIPTYARLLMGGELTGMLMDAFACYPDIPPRKICIELSADILYEDVKTAKEQIDELREMGVKVAISEVGDEFCPVFRLAELAFDYAFVDPFVTDTLDDENVERVAGSIVKFLHFVGVKVIAPALANDEMLAGAKNADFDGYGRMEELPDFLQEKPAEEEQPEAESEEPPKEDLLFAGESPEKPALKFVEDDEDEDDDEEDDDE